MSNFEQQANDAIRQSIADSMTTSNTEQQEQQQPTQEQPADRYIEQNSSSEGQNFSTDQVNPDLSGGTSDNVSDDPIDNLISNTFGGDPKKIAKSYLESQRAYTKLQSQLGERDQRLQKYESQLQQFDQILQQYPDLANQVEKAVRGQYESPAAARQEPQGKPVPNAYSGKLGDDALPTEQTLIDSGYLDSNARNNLSSFDYQQRVMAAQMQYMQTELPNQIMQKTMQQLQQQQQQYQAQQYQSQIQQQNDERFNESFDRAVSKYGLNFNDTHAHLFDEITEAVTAFRDPRNKDLINPKAVELATQLVLESHEMLPSSQPTAPQIPQQPVGDDGFNSSRSATIASKPTDFASKQQQNVTDRLLQDLQRRNIGRSNMQR